MEGLLDRREALLNDVNWLNKKRIELISARETSCISQDVHSFFTCSLFLVFAWIASKFMRTLINQPSDQSQRFVLQARKILGVKSIETGWLTKFNRFLLAIGITLATNVPYVIILLEKSKLVGEPSYASIMTLSVIPLQIVWSIVSRISPAIRDEIYNICFYTIFSLIFAAVALVFSSKKRNNSREDCIRYIADTVADIILFRQQKQLENDPDHSKPIDLNQLDRVQVPRKILSNQSRKTKAICRSFTG